MDQHVSWCLPTEDLSLDVIWSKHEDFCKPQTNEVSARFDLLTSFRQGNISVNEWYNAVQAQVSLAKYPPGNASILHRYTFWFFLKDEFVSKTINGSNIDLDKFPASKVRQLAKKMVSSKSTTRHIKAVASDPQVAQVNLMRFKELTSHQGSPSGNNILTSLNQRRGTQVNTKIKDHPLRSWIQAKHTKEENNVQSCRRFQVSCQEVKCKTYNKYGHFTSLCYKKQ